MEPLFTVELLLIPSQVEFQLVPAVSASLVELVLTRSTSLQNFDASGTAYFWNGDAGVDSINLSAATAVTQNLGFGVSTGSGLIVSGSTSNIFANNSTNLFTFNGGTATGGLVTIVHHYFNPLH